MLTASGVGRGEQPATILDAVAKVEISVEAIADWLVGVLDEEYEVVWSREHPMDDFDWVRRRNLVEQCRKSRDITRLRCLAAEYANMPGYRWEWAS
jgi:hypothetical protein